MPVTFDQLVARVCETLLPEQTDVDRDKVARVVRATLKGLDMHVNTATGEVYSPAPQPVAVFSGVRPRTDTGVRFYGQRRRRGYRR